MEICRINISKLIRFNLIEDDNQTVSFIINGHEYNMKFQTINIQVDIDGNRNYTLRDGNKK